MQAWMDDVYKVFKGHVQAIRGSRLKKPLDELAGGRVFTGKQALELGLVDRIGGLGDAIAHVAGRGQADGDYDVRMVPRTRTSSSNWSRMPRVPADDSPGIAFASQADRRRAGFAGRPGDAVAFGTSTRSGSPPIRDALRHSQLLQREGVLLMMPETAIPR